MEKQDIIVIGSSAGGVNALKELVKSFSKDFPASIFIVQHLAADTESYLPTILSNSGPLKAFHPKDGEPLVQGCIYIAPPDHHLILNDGYIQVKKGPKENRFRPCIDVTMRSAAYWYGPRVVGTVLTGRLNDGTSGLWSIKELGGTTIVQSPDDALFPDMPRSALGKTEVDYILPLADIGAVIVGLVGQPVKAAAENQPVRKRMKVEIDIAAQKNAFERGIINMGKKTDLTCPECGGALVSIQEGNKVRYRCHTGHGFSSESLWSGITENIEVKLWQAMRSMEEGVILLEQTAAQCEHMGQDADVSGFMQKAADLRNRSKALLALIYNGGQVNLNVV